MTLKELTATVEAMKPQIALLESRTLDLESEKKVLMEKVSEATRVNAAQEEKIKALEASNVELQSELKVVKERVLVAHRSNTANEKKFETLDHKIEMVANEREQRERNPTVRWFNCKVTDSAKKSSIVLTNELYDTFLHKIFTRAMEDGLVKAIPKPTEIIEYAHILPSKKPDPKPAPFLPPGAPQPTHKDSAPFEDTLISKFTSRNYKYIVHKYKKEILNEINKDKDKNIEIYDDLTKVNLDCLRFLKSDANSHLVEKAFVLSGKIKFVLKSNPQKLLTVINPFEKDVKKLNKKSI
jgi:hypothetical protein